MEIHKRVCLHQFTGVAIAVALTIPVSAYGQDVWPPKDNRAFEVQSSPFAPPAKDDVTFVVDDAPGLDTGCTFRDGGPLVFDIPITRHVGDVQKLLSNGAILPTATLRMPAYDVDFNGSPPPERDRVSINGNVVPGEWLSGDDGVWKLNAWEVPVEWLNFPAAGDPKANPAMNTVRIDIDTASTSQRWCTAIDWATLSIEVTRPHLLVHGILSDGSTWGGTWSNGLAGRGIPFDTIDLTPGDIALDSIADNAGDIEVKVNELKTLWGVDKLNIVAHSKGGIDSRHFAESDDSISRLTQIGTPNAGSPIANYVQAGSIFFLGLGGTVLANVFAGPAGYQLTTPYMAGYNAFHGHNADTTYVSLAGNYTGGGTVDSVLNFLIAGDDDTIVPVSSVHALGYATHLTYSSSGANTQAKHTAQTASGDIFASLIGATSAPVGADGAPAVAGASQFSFTPSAYTAPLAGSVAQGEAMQHTVSVDGSGKGSFTLLYGNGDLDLVVVSPSGQRIDPVTAQFDANVEFASDESTPGFKIESYTFNSFEQGAWQVEVSGANVATPPGSESYLVSAWMENTSITMTAVARNAAVSVGDPLVLDATLDDAGTPLVGALVEASIQAPDGSLDNLVLVDDGVSPDQATGDGIYSGSSSATAVAGIHNISVTAHGTSPAFSRQVLAVASAALSSSSFTGGYSDFGVDSDSNGLFELLAIEVEVDIDQQADYIMVGELSSPSGALIASETVRATLVPGVQTLRLNFPGQAIFDQGENGPYTLSSLRLAEETVAGDVLVLQQLSNAHVTAAYQLSDFERSSILFLGTGTETPVDSNANGLYDALHVSLDVDLQFSGSYQWTARLLDRRNTEIEFVSGGGFLSSGAETISLVFDGNAIGTNGANGPYEVSDLLILGAGQSQSVTSAYETEAYLADDFEGFAGLLEGDFNGDNCIDRADMSILLTTVRSELGDVAVHDLNGDNLVNISDARKLVTLFTNPRGAACP